MWDSDIPRQTFKHPGCLHLFPISLSNKKSLIISANKLLLLFFFLVLWKIILVGWTSRSIMFGKRTEPGKVTSPGPALTLTLTLTLTLMLTLMLMLGEVVPSQGFSAPTYKIIRVNWKLFKGPLLLWHSGMYSMAKLYLILIKLHPL